MIHWYTVNIYFFHWLTINIFWPIARKNTARWERQMEIEISERQSWTERHE